jgi:hypothetical protein
MSYRTFELKYCERCGGLGVRRPHSGAAYCFGCAHMMRNFLVRPPSLPERPRITSVFLLMKEARYA